MDSVQIGKALVCERKLHYTGLSALDMEIKFIAESEYIISSHKGGVSGTETPKIQALPKLG